MKSGCPVPIKRADARYIDSKICLVLLDVEVVGEVIFDDAVALTGAAFEAWAIDNRDFAPGVLNEAFALQGFRGDADGGTIAAEHIGEVFVGEGEDGRRGTVAAEEQPSCEALRDGMAGVATSGLRGLNQLRLHGPQDEVVEAAEAGEFLDGQVHAAGEAVAGHLHIDLVEAAARPDECGCTHDGFNAVHADLDLETVAEGGGHGANAILNKDEMADGFAGIFDLAAGLKP